MKHYTLIILSLLLFFSNEASAITKAKTTKQTESLQYDVYYHWGIIWMKAGRGELCLYDETTDNDSQRVHAKLTGRTLSIAEKIMTVRDTLECWYSPDIVPLEFVKKTNEGSYKAIERNYYTYSLKDGDALTPDNIKSTDVELRRWRLKKGNDSQKFNIEGLGYDMLSAFYMVRSLDFEKMTPGTRIQFPVFAGIKKEKMSIKYVNKTTTKLRDGRKFPAYKVEMAINTKDEEGAPLYVWLSTDKSHRPLNVIIQLRRIGAIQCEIAE